MKNHATIKNELYDFVMNELPEKEHKQIEVHLQECQECSREVQGLKLFAEQLRTETTDWS